MAIPKGANPPKISPPASTVPSKNRMAHSLERTSMGERSMSRFVSSAFAPSRAARIFRFSAITVSSYVRGRSRPSVKVSIFHILENT